mmetsp:Transcript_29649/g.74606  ORF Transcript_29649/g.74606 Transcript_29649/m.74606 type:complete len:200 (-) Transcript_29649:29-628(-)
MPARVAGVRALPRGSPRCPGHLRCPSVRRCHLLGKCRAAPPRVGKRSAALGAGVPIGHGSHPERPAPPAGLRGRPLRAARPSTVSRQKARHRALGRGRAWRVVLGAWQPARVGRSSRVICRRPRTAHWALVDLGGAPAASASSPQAECDGNGFRRCSKAPRARAAAAGRVSPGRPGRVPRWRRHPRRPTRLARGPPAAR